MSTKKSKYVKLGAIIKGKDGSLYIKIDNDVTLNVNGKLYDGKYINMDKPADKIKFFLDKGYITEEVAEERLSKVPDFVKYDLTIKHND